MKTKVPHYKSQTEPSRYRGAVPSRVIVTRPSTLMSPAELYARFSHAEPIPDQLNLKGTFSEADWTSYTKMDNFQKADFARDLAKRVTLEETKRRNLADAAYRKRVAEAQARTAQLALDNENLKRQLESAAKSL